MPPVLLVEVFPVLLLDVLLELLMAVLPVLLLDMPPVIVVDTPLDELVVLLPVLLVDFPPELLGDVPPLLLVDVPAAFADAFADAETKAVANETSLDACIASIWGNQLCHAGESRYNGRIGLEIGE